MKKTTKKLLAFLSALTISASMVCSFGVSADNQVTDSSVSVETTSDYVKGYLLENAREGFVIDKNLQEFLDKYAVDDELSKRLYDARMTYYENEIKNGDYSKHPTKNIVFPKSLCLLAIDHSAGVYAPSINYMPYYLGVVKYGGTYRHAILLQHDGIYNQTLCLEDIDPYYDVYSRIVDERFDGDPNGYITKMVERKTSSGNIYLQEKKFDAWNLWDLVTDYYDETELSYYYTSERKGNLIHHVPKDPVLGYNTTADFRKKILSGEIELLNKIPKDLLDINEVILDDWKFDMLPYEEKVEKWLDCEKYISKQGGHTFISGSELPKNSPYHAGNAHVWQEVFDEILNQYRDKGYDYILNNAKDYTYEEIVKMVQARIEGDANEDGKTTISDAILVMQSVANPDKYQLTDQAMFNADFNGDGITSLDAYMIQKSLLSQ